MPNGKKSQQGKKRSIGKRLKRAKYAKIRQK